MDGIFRVEAGNPAVVEHVQKLRALHSAVGAPLTKERGPGIHRLSAWGELIVHQREKQILIMNRLFDSKGHSCSGGGAKSRIDLNQH